MASLITLIIFLLLSLSHQSPPPLHRPPLTTWTSLILTHHGERRPLLTHPHSTLTPLGAHQAHSSGSLLRRRYLTGPSAYNTSFVPLHGFHKNYIDNQRVQVLSAPEQPVVASAWAFLQGLYPPVDAPAMVGGSPKAGGGGWEAPLGGYQYGRVETAGGRDWNNIWIAGSDRCALHAASTAAQINSSVYIDTTEASAPFFASMIPSVFGGVVPEMMVTYHNAPALYDYAAYATLHNSTVAETLPASALARLRALAGKRFWGVHGVQRGTGEGEEGDGEQDAILKPIAGRTFAERVLYLLTRTTTSERPGALNLLFSSSAPFVGFSSISGLAEQDARFKGVVEPGSMMVFEVFSYTDPEAGRPGKEDLWVRFLYRNGTAEGARLVGYPLFGRGRSKMDMRFSEFEKEMGAIGKGVGEWCEVCGVGPVFCPAFVEGLDKGRKEEEEKGKDGDGEGGKKKKKGTTALELGLGLGAAGFVVVFGGLVMVFCARSRRRKEVRDKEEGWEMGDRGAKEERVRSGEDYEVRNEDEETVNPMREPVRVEDRV